jgi:inner membrane protein
VDGYQRTERALKYGLLVVVLTFLAFFLFEIGSELRLHVVQYGLVGAALCVFYLLLLSLSEHLGFGAAYLSAAAATVGLISAYVTAILRGGRRAAAFAGLLAGLYGGLYALLVTEDLALLVGSVALFSVLALLMWRTRHVDWRRPLGEEPQRPAGVSSASGAGSL